MNQVATITLHFLGASNISTVPLLAAWVIKWKKVAPTKAENIGGANPVDEIGERPLSKGKNIPPQPAIVPQMMGPKTGKLKWVGEMVEAARAVKRVTT